MYVCSAIAHCHVGPELMEKFSAQAKRFGAQVIEEWATDFQFKPGGPHRVKIGVQVYETEAIILANGAAAKWLNAPGEERFRYDAVSSF